MRDGKHGDGACPACGQPAACGMADGQPTCWCFELPPAMPMPPAGTAARCYCRRCLEKLVSVGGGEPVAAATRSAKRDSDSAEA